MKYQNDENVVAFVPMGKRKSPKSMRLFPNDDLAPCTCQFPTSVPFEGIAYETVAFVVTLSTRHPRAMSSLVVWTGKLLWTGLTGFTRF